MVAIVTRRPWNVVDHLLILPLWQEPFNTSQRTFIWNFSSRFRGFKMSGILSEYGGSSRDTLNIVLPCSYVNSGTLSVSLMVIF